MVRKRVLAALLVTAAFSIASSVLSVASPSEKTAVGPSEFRRLYQRLLDLPQVPAGAPCPISVPHDLAHGHSVLGEGPIFVWAQSAEVRYGPRLTKPGARGWHPSKGVLFSDSTYAGPVLVRASRLDGRGRPRLAPLSRKGRDALEFPSGDAHTGSPFPQGWRSWPLNPLFRNPGCYAFQIDTEQATDVIVFLARRDR